MNANSTENEHTQRVSRMFGRIARHYDLLNRVMTLGQDQSWRREAIRHLDPQPGQRILDAGAGTGDIALLIRQQHPNTQVIAADLTPGMVWQAQARAGGSQVQWVIADAMHLPFCAEAFDGVISGYLLRNVPEVGGALNEQRRILQPGGHMVSLDTTPPRRNLLYPFIQFHMHVIIPALGRLIAGDADAYTYLPDTTEHFLAAETLAERMRMAGFKAVGFVRRMFGTMAIHWGKKADRETT